MSKRETAFFVFMISVACMFFVVVQTPWGLLALVAWILYLYWMYK